MAITYGENCKALEILPPVDWMEVFKQNAQAKKLFELSIPVAIKRRANVENLKKTSIDSYVEIFEDIILGHFAIVSESELIRKRFFDIFNEVYLRTTNYKRTASWAIECGGDMASILAGIDIGEALIIDMNGKMKEDVTTILSKALREFCFNFVIGKGEAKRNITLDIPAFTSVFFAENTNEIPDDVLNSLYSIIEINLSQEELDILQIREIAALYDVCLTEESLEVIKNYIVKMEFKNIKSILRFISDYLLLHDEIMQPLSENEMREIIEKF